MTKSAQKNQEYDWKAASHAAMFFGMGNWYFMNPQELDEWVAKREQLPTFGEVALAAKFRNKLRRFRRKLAVKLSNVLISIV